MISILPIADPVAIDSILRDPAIASRIGHDGREAGHIEHPAVSYWGAYLEGSLVGIFTAIRFSRWEVEAHVAIIPDAIRHVRALAGLFIDTMFADADVARLTAYVLGTLPSAANFCRKVGFVDEGRRRDACEVSGKPTDIIILGMTRHDWRLHREHVSAKT